MSKLRELLKEAYKDKDIQERVYGKFPFEIAKQCGADDVKDIILLLDELQLEKAKIEELRVLIVAHCERQFGEIIRIISARKATKKERKFYRGGAV